MKTKEIQLTVDEVINWIERYLRAAVMEMKYDFMGDDELSEAYWVMRKGEVFQMAKYCIHIVNTNHYALTAYLEWWPEFANDFNIDHYASDDSWVSEGEWLMKAHDWLSECSMEQYGG